MWKWYAPRRIRRVLTTLSMTRRQNSPFCPHCGGISAYRHGMNKQKRKRYRCKDCHKTFCLRTNTVRAYSHLSEEEWKQSIRLFSLRGGISGADLARFHERHIKTGQRINRILRIQTGKLPIPKLNGINESDETTMTGKWVWGCVSRDSKQVVLESIDQRDENTLQTLIMKHTAKNCDIFTDEWGGYRNLWYWRSHLTVNHSKEFVSSHLRIVHTNTQEGVWGQIKPFARHIYRGIPTSKLNSFLKEFMFRYNLKDYNTRVKSLYSYTSLNFHTLWV